MFTLGRFTFDNILALSPMAGVSDKPFREICREAGAGFTYTEMLTSKTELWSTAKSQQRLSFADEPSPRIVQIAGTEPQQLAHAAQQAVDLGADVIDINMGCPAKKVCKKLAGSALMQDELLVAQILEAVVNSIDEPVTLKTRTGWNRDNKNVLNIARIAEESGIQAIAVHGRTREDAYKGEASYELITQVKQTLNIPVLANGDINSASKAASVLKQTGADGLLIGRGAQGKPWIFKEINQYLQAEKKPAKLTSDAISNTVLKHLRLIYDHYGPVTGTRIARKHIGWYLKGQFEDIRKSINTTNEPKEQYRIMQHFFESVADNKDIGDLLS